LPIPPGDARTELGAFLRLTVLGMQVSVVAPANFVAARELFSTRF
jgi:hypothetical protein